jgi:hypothetical protein
MCFFILSSVWLQTNLHKKCHNVLILKYCVWVCVCEAIAFGHVQCIGLLYCLYCLVVWSIRYIDVRLYCCDIVNHHHLLLFEVPITLLRYFYNKKSKLNMYTFFFKDSRDWGKKHIECVLNSKESPIVTLTSKRGQHEMPDLSL